jgi:hypothetical protein
LAAQGAAQVVVVERREKKRRGMASTLGDDGQSVIFVEKIMKRLLKVPQANVTTHIREYIQVM